MPYSPGDAAAGAQIFKARCLHCHTIDKGAPHGFGPNLYGLFGRKSSQLQGYKFSPAHLQKDLFWTEDVLFDYIENPKQYIPGTKKPYAGLKKASERNDVIEYMKQVKSK